MLMPRGSGRAEDSLLPSSAQLPVGVHTVWHNAGSGLYRRYRRWANVNPAFVQCLVLGVSITGTTMHWTDVAPLSATLAQH